MFYFTFFLRGEVKDFVKRLNIKKGRESVKSSLKLRDVIDGRPSNLDVIAEIAADAHQLLDRHQKLRIGEETIIQAGR